MQISSQSFFSNSSSATARALQHPREGPPSTLQLRAAPQREHIDPPDLHRAFSEFSATENKTHPRVTAPQRERFEGSSRTLQFRTAPQRERFHTHNLRGGFDASSTRHSESASTRAISSEDSPRSKHIRAAPKPGCFDTHDLRQGSAELKTHSHCTTARALRRARSSQRNRRGQDTFARRRSKSASTRTVSTEGCVSIALVGPARRRNTKD